MIYQKDNYYHIYNRGCDKNLIFFNKENYHYLIKRMKRSFRKFHIRIIAFCLMPNHYHLLVKQNSDIPISKWLHSIFVGYSMAVNRQQNRQGTLFGGHTKSKLIEDLKYLGHLMYYIHNNPVSAGLVSKPEQWEYSNYSECVGIRNNFTFDNAFMKEFFNSRIDYQEFFENYKPASELKNVMKKFNLDET